MGLWLSSGSFGVYVNDTGSYVAVMRSLWLIQGVCGCYGVFVADILRLHKAPIPGSNPGRWVRSILGGGGGFHWPAFKEQTPQVGQNKRVQVRNFSCYTWKMCLSLQWQTQLFVYTHKKWCQTPHAWSNPTNLEEQKRWVRPRNQGRWFAFTLRGKSWVWPAIGALCKCGNRLCGCIYGWYGVYVAVMETLWSDTGSMSQNLFCKKLL